jgi:F0F1-type ATP synthase assembly protein I
MDTSDKRELNKGFGDALNRAVEIVATPGIFAFFGWLLDNKLGTTPVFALLFGVAVFGYVMTKMYTRYGQDMRRHEQQLGATARERLG